MIPWSLLNEVPEHMAQEFSIPIREQGIGRVSSMKFLSTWLRNADNHPCHAHTCLLNEVPEHMAQEFEFFGGGFIQLVESSMKFLSTWLRNILL